MRALPLILFLAACDAGHLGNPLTLPIRGAASAIENASYDARRGRVKAYLSAHQFSLNAPEGQAGLWEASTVPPKNRAKVLQEIAALPSGPDWAEQATVIVMVHT